MSYFKYLSAKQAKWAITGYLPASCRVKTILVFGLEAYIRISLQNIWLLAKLIDACNHVD